MSEKNAYSAIIFDMDGVIIDSREHVEAFWYEKLNQYGIAAPEGEDLEKKFHGRPARPTVNSLFASLPEETREEIIEECARHDASVEKFKMIPGVGKFIRQCSDANIRLGLCTSALPGKVSRMLAGLDYPSPFEAIVTADIVEKGKPDPECYLTTASRLNIEPGRVIVFEDSVSGVESAKAAGATVVGVNEGIASELLSEAGAYTVISSFENAAIDVGNSSVRLYPDKENDGLFFTLTK